MFIQLGIYMELETLLKGLTEPRILSDGTIRTPNNFMLWAARVIKDFMPIKQNSDDNMFKAQARSDSDRMELIEYITKYNELMLTVYELRKLQTPDFTEYNEIMNKDRE